MQVKPKQTEDLITYRVPADQKQLHVLNFSDLHAGDKYFDQEKFEYLVKLVEKERMRCNIVGDAFAMAMKGSKGAPRDLIWDADLTSEYLYAQFKRILDFIDSISPGNHDYRPVNEGATNPVKALVRALGIQDRYRDTTAMVEYATEGPNNKMSYLVYYFHGNAGGRTAGAALSACEKAVLRANADIYVMGHMHVASFSGAKERTDADKRNKKTFQAPYWLVTNGSLQEGKGSYAERNCYTLARTTQTLMTLSMIKGEKDVGVQMI